MTEARTYDQLSAGLLPRSLAAAANAFGMTESKFIMLVGGWDGDPVDSIKDEVNDWVYRYAKTALTSGVDNSEVSFTLDDAADALTGCFLLIDDEIVYVSNGAGSNPITVTRAQRGTDAAPHDAATKVSIIGKPRAESHSWGSGRVRTPVNIVNYVQLEATDVKVPDMVKDQRHIGLPGGQSNYLVADIGMTMREMMRVFNRAALYSRKHASTPQGSDSIIRTMHGLNASISLAGVNASGASLNKATHIDAALLQIRDAGGPAPTHFVMPPRQALKLENLLSPFNASNTSANQQFGTVVSSIVSTLTGPMGIVIDDDVRDDMIFIVHAPLIEFRPFGNPEKKHVIRYEPMGRASLSDGGIVTGAYTLRVFGGSYAHTKIYDLSVS